MYKGPRLERHHITLVIAGAIPRFAYTIGISRIIGAELIFTGGAFYSAEEVKEIINGTAKNLVTTSTPYRRNLWRQLTLMRFAENGSPKQPDGKMINGNCSLGQDLMRQHQMFV